MRRKLSSVQRKVYLSPEVSARVNIHLADSTNQKIAYGALSHLVEALLINYLDKVDSLKAKDLEDIA